MFIVLPYIKTQKYINPVILCFFQSLTGPSSDKDFTQIWEDETGYSADGETSSSGSEKEISDSEDELNKINTCKGNEK